MILFYNMIPFEWYKIASIICKSYASRKLTYPFEHHRTKLNLRYLQFFIHVDRVTCGTSRKFYKDQNANPNWDLRHAETLKLTL